MNNVAKFEDGECSKKYFQDGEIIKGKKCK